MAVEAGVRNPCVHGDFVAEQREGLGACPSAARETCMVITLFQCPPGQLKEGRKWVTGSVMFIPGETSLEAWRSCIQESPASGRVGDRQHHLDGTDCRPADSWRTRSPCSASGRDDGGYSQVGGPALPFPPS